MILTTTSKITSYQWASVANPRLFQITPRQVQRIFKKVCEQAGVKGLVPHSMRQWQSLTEYFKKAEPLGRAGDPRTLNNYL